MTPTRSKSDSELYQKTTLKNGLRVLTERIPSVRSISLGVWVDVGSRNEAPHENGVTHLIEHMLFKGTKRRSAKDIASSLESIGGNLNAFTAREQTCYTARILDERLADAVDVLADITGHATLTPANLKREKLVVGEEIKESVDNPSDHIHDLFAETFWGGHALGQPILGHMDTVLAMPRKVITGYVRRNYRNESIVIAASGAVSHRKLLALVRKKFEFADGAAPEPAPAERGATPAVAHETSDMNQTHLCVGYPGVSFDSRQKLAALTLTTYLGGGMSSILFQKIREERGLAYSVYCYHDFYRDGGIFGTYVGTDKGHVEKAFDIIQAEIKRVKTRKLSSQRLTQIKNQLKGHLILGMESTASRMNRLGRQELMLGKFVPMAKTMRDIGRVTSSQVMEIANEMFDPSQIAVAALGPADRKFVAKLRKKS